MTITVQSIARLDRETTAKGYKHLAYCTVEISNLLTVQGCLLVEHEDFGRRLWAPSLTNSQTGYKSGVKLGDTLRDAIADVASAAYDALLSNDSRTSPPVSAAVELVRQVEARGVV